MFQTSGVESLGNYPGGWLGEGMKPGCHAPGLQGLGSPAGNGSIAASEGACEKIPFFPLAAMLINKTNARLPTLDPFWHLFAQLELAFKCLLSLWGLRE